MSVVAEMHTWMQDLCINPVINYIFFEYDYLLTCTESLQGVTRYSNSLNYFPF